MFLWNKLERVGTSWNKNIWELVPLWTRPEGRGGKRFLGLTGLTAGGFLSLTAFQAEGCGLPLRGDAYKVSVTD